MHKLFNCFAKKARSLMILALALLAVSQSLLGPALAQDASRLPEPASPTRSTIVDGRLNVYMGTARVNGHAIGDSIPVTIVFEMIPATPEDLAPPAVKDEKIGVEKAKAPAYLPMPRVNVEGLKMQVGSADPQDTEMLTAATEIHRYTRDGKEYLKVVFYVWQFVTTKQSQVEIAADFMYAIHVLEDGQPDWRKASTGKLIVGIRKTANDNQVTILEGDLKLKSSPVAPAAAWFLILGPALLLPLLASLALMAYTRATAKPKLTANEEAWLVLDPVLASGIAGKFSIEDYKLIFFTLRRRFEVLALDGQELFAALAKREDLKHVDFDVVERVFSKESVFYAKASDVSIEQQHAFIEGIKLILPRH